MSPTSSLSRNVAEARRTSPGFTPKRRAAARLTSTCTCGDDVPDQVRFVAEDLQVRAEDPHDDRFARARENLVDPLVQVGLNIVEDARVPVDGLLERAESLVVVCGRIDRDPVLAEVDAHGLVGEERLSDVRPEVLYSWNRTELTACAGDDAALLREGGAGLRDPVPEEVPLFERGDQRLAEEGQDGDARRDGKPGRQIRRARPRDDP